MPASGVERGSTRYSAFDEAQYRGRQTRRACSRVGRKAFPMTRYGAMFGPDITFLGVERCDLDEPDTYRDADIVILGAPFDGGTSNRPGARFGPKAVRQACYLAHDGSRPSLALRVDGLADLVVRDAGDVETYAGDIETALANIEEAVYKITAAGAIPVVIGGDHTIALPDARGVARHHGFGRVSMLHFDAHADTGDIDFGHLHGHGQPMRRCRRAHRS